MKQFIMALGALLIVAGSGCGRTETTPSVPPKVVRVEASHAIERNFERRVRVQGTVVPVEEAEIASRTDGCLDALPVREGSKVRKGDVLFRVDQKNLENRVAVAEQELAVARDNARTAAADLEIARTKCRKAELDYKRAEQLIQSDAISADAFETGQMKFQNAEAEIKKYESMLNYSRTKVRQQEIQLEIARKNLDDSRVLAPFPGVVTAKYKEPEEYVKAGDSILHLENPSRFEISCMISAVYHPAVAEGKTRGRVRFDRHELGVVQVSYRASSIDPLSRTFELKFAVPPEIKLISGVLCDIDLILEERRGLGLPAEAVMLRNGGASQAYAVRDGRAEIVAVTPGITDGGFTELRNADSLRAELFVVSGQYFLNAGDRVEVVAPAAEKSGAR